MPIVVDEAVLSSLHAHLEHDDCFELLTSRHLGRVAFQLDGPLILPVNYAVDQCTIVFRTSPHGLLGQHLRRGEVAFEVDEIDPGSGAGWSVLLRGAVTPLAAAEVQALQQAPPAWPDGVQSLYLRVTPQGVTGRRYSAVTIAEQPPGRPVAREELG